MKTYLGVICSNCQQPAPFIEINHGDQIQDVQGAFRVECPHCHQDQEYQPHELKKIEVGKKH